MFMSHTREDEVYQDSASSVPNTADGGKVGIQDQETDAAKETGHSNSNAVVTGVSVVVEDAEQTLAANVDVALVHDAAEHHYGENLQGETRGLLSNMSSFIPQTHLHKQTPLLSRCVWMRGRDTLCICWTGRMESGERRRGTRSNKPKLIHPLL